MNPCKGQSCPKNIWTTLSLYDVCRLVYSYGIEFFLYKLPTDYVKENLLMKKHLKKLCICLAFISILRFSNGFLSLKIPFNHHECPISTYNDIPDSPINEH